MSRKYGYIRVSSKEQNSDRQRQAMLDAGVKENRIIEDKISGKDFNREGYKYLTKQLLRKDDILFVKELDRLGRNAEKIKEEWKDLTDMGVDIVVLDMDILDTRQYKNGTEKLITNIVLELLSYMAEQERNKIRKRQAEGIKEARRKGVDLGRPKMEMLDNFDKYYKKVYIDDDMTAVEAYKELDISKTKFYDFKKKYEKENNI
jgi:DNA invertase Pin-like site-specific DNA recombinase